jgi:hypothetical protein
LVRALAWPTRSCHLIGLAFEWIIARYGLAAVCPTAGIEGETSVLAGGVLKHQHLISLPAVAIVAAVGSARSMPSLGDFWAMFSLHPFDGQLPISNLNLAHIRTDDLLLSSASDLSNALVSTYPWQRMRNSHDVLLWKTSDRTAMSEMRARAGSI